MESSPLAMRGVALPGPLRWTAKNRCQRNRESSRGAASGRLRGLARPRPRKRVSFEHRARKLALRTSGSTASCELALEFADVAELSRFCSRPLLAAPANIEPERRSMVRIRAMGGPWLGAGSQMRMFRCFARADARRRARAHVGARRASGRAGRAVRTWFARDAKLLRVWRLSAAVCTRDLSGALMIHRVSPPRQAEWLGGETSGLFRLGHSTVRCMVRWGAPGCAGVRCMARRSTLLHLGPVDVEIVVPAGLVVLRFAGIDRTSPFVFLAELVYAIAHTATADILHMIRGFLVTMYIADTRWRLEPRSSR